MRQSSAPEALCDPSCKGSPGALRIERELVGPVVQAAGPLPEAKGCGVSLLQSHPPATLSFSLSLSLSLLSLSLSLS